MPKPETRTDVRTTVETEEITYYECPSCNQFVEDTELVPALLGIDPAIIDRYREKTLERRRYVCCRYCAESIWGVDSEYMDGRAFKMMSQLDAGLEGATSVTRAVGGLPRLSLLQFIVSYYLMFCGLAYSTASLGLGAPVALILFGALIIVMIVHVNAIGDG